MMRPLGYDTSHYRQRRRVRELRDKTLWSEWRMYPQARSTYEEDRPPPHVGARRPAWLQGPIVVRQTCLCVCEIHPASRFSTVLVDASPPDRRIKRRPSTASSLKRNRSGCEGKAQQVRRGREGGACSKMATSARVRDAPPGPTKRYLPVRAKPTLPPSSQQCSWTRRHRIRRIKRCPSTPLSKSKCRRERPFFRCRLAAGAGVAGRSVGVSAYDL